MFNTKYNTLRKNNSWKGAIQLLRSHLEGKWDPLVSLEFTHEHF